MKSFIPALAIVIVCGCSRPGDNQFASTNIYATNGLPWQVVSYKPSPGIFTSKGYEVFDGQPPPLNINIEIKGTFPNLADIQTQVRNCFTFWNMANNQPIAPYYGTLPKIQPDNMSGDPTKTIRFEVYLCDAREGTQILRGYTPESVALSYNGGPKVPLTKFVSKPETK